MDLVGRSVPSFQKVVVWPFNVIIQEEVSHQEFELIDRKESTRTIKRVSALFYQCDLQRWRVFTTHAFRDQREGVVGWS